MSTFLVRYGEIGLKGFPVRKRFESILVENILRAHSLSNVSCIVERLPGRFFVTTEQPSVTVGILSRSFGVVSVSQVEETTSDPEAIAARAVELAKKKLSKKASFAVRARRTGDHKYTSMELASLIGKKILEEIGQNSVRVSLSSPDEEIFVEVRNNKAYLFGEIIPGPGGLPLRSQGRILSLIEDRKSLLACWLMMKRGCNVVLLNRSDLDLKTVEILKPWNPWWRGPLEWNEGSLQDLIRLKHCSGLVLGWMLAEFESREIIQLNMPVFYPLIGMAQGQIAEHLKRLFSA